MKIDLENQKKNFPLNLTRIKKIVRKILIKEGKSNKSEVNIIFTDNLKISRLNKKYLKRAQATDVLAFPMQEGMKIKGDPYLLGDMVISSQMAAAYAKELKGSVLNEIYLYVIHGLLHLLGYDHENLKDNLLMREKEREYLLLCRAKNAG